MKDSIKNSAYSVRLEKAVSWIANGGLKKAIAVREATIERADLQIAALKAERAKANFELASLSRIEKRVYTAEQARYRALQGGLATAVAKAAEATAIREAVQEFLSIDELDTIMSEGLGIPRFHQDDSDFDLSPSARWAMIEKLAKDPDYAFADGEAEEIISKAEARHPEWAEMDQAKAVIRVMETYDYGSMTEKDLREGALALRAVAERASTFIPPLERMQAAVDDLKSFEGLLEKTRLSTLQQGMNSHTSATEGSTYFKEAERRKEAEAHMLNFVTDLINRAHAFDRPEPETKRQTVEVNFNAFRPDTLVGVNDDALDQLLAALDRQAFLQRIAS